MTLPLLEALAAGGGSTGLSLQGLPGQCTRNVVESGVAKHTSEDTPDSGVEFITPAVQGESVPNRDPDVSRGPVLYPPLRNWLHVSSLFVVYD